MNTNVDLDYGTPSAVPVRFHAGANWNLGLCKRCLLNNVQPGDVLVRIFGTGWWHDACYIVVNPDFYRGLANAPKALVSVDVFVSERHLADHLKRWRGLTRREKVVAALRDDGKGNVYPAPGRRCRLQTLLESGEWKDWTKHPVYHVAERDGLLVLHEVRG